MSSGASSARPALSGEPLLHADRPACDAVRADIDQDSMSADALTEHHAEDGTIRGDGGSGW